MLSYSSRTADSCDRRAVFGMSRGNIVPSSKVSYRKRVAMDDRNQIDDNHTRRPTGTISYRSHIAHLIAQFKPNYTPEPVDIPEPLATPEPPDIRSTGSSLCCDCCLIDLCRNVGFQNLLSQ